MHADPPPAGPVRSPGGPRRSRFRPPLGQLAAILFIGAVLAPFAGSLAQQTPPTEPPRGAADDASIERLLELHLTEEERVRLVLLAVTVTDKRGRAVLGLRQEDFLVLEDFVPQEIRYFSAEQNEAVSMAFLLDLSGSMRQVGKLEEAKESIRTFVEALRPTDKFALVGFADDQVSWITPFTTDRDLFLRRLAVQRGYGQTALYDAVAATPTLVDQRATGRKAIVLITDGIDNASSMSVFKARQLARQVEVPIYAIGFTNRSPKLQRKGSRPPGERVLGLFTEETGGVLLTVHDPADLKEAVRTIDAELRNSYLIGFYPQRRYWDGEFRRILVHVKDGRYQARTRRGYYAAP